VDFTIKQPKAQGKLVIVLRGRIFDIAVDMRQGSRTYGTWVGEELSDKPIKMSMLKANFKKRLTRWTMPPN
jgi:dTDP-4-dehydrorhamnose 3,5-epimerase